MQKGAFQLRKKGGILELGIQVAPATTARVVTWRRLATGRATWLCTRFPFHVDDDLPLGHINLHIGDSPRCLNTQYPGV